MKAAFSSAEGERSRTGKFGKYKLIERGELVGNEFLTSVPGVQLRAQDSKELISIIPGVSIEFEGKSYWIAGQCSNYL